MKKKMKKKKKKPKSTESQWMSSSSAWTTEKVVKLALSDEDVRPPMGLDCPALTAEEVRRPCSSKPDVPLPHRPYLRYQSRLNPCGMFWGRFKLASRQRASSSRCSFR